MKDPRDIIIASVVSEKIYALIEEGVYTFRVHSSASKPEIRDAVETIWVGTPVDTGRDAVDGDYEVGLCVGFETMEGLQEYLQDPRHLELVALWKPRATGFRIFDVGSPELRR